jgi:hypothetical protein
MINIEANWPQQSTPASTVLRMRPIVHLSEEGYSIKHNATRTRLTIIPSYAAGVNRRGPPTKVRVISSELPAVDVNAPYKPRYPHNPSDDYTFDYVTQYEAFVMHCVAILCKPNMYSEGTYDKIRYTTDLSEMSPGVFFAGQITSAFAGDDGVWSIVVGEKHRVRVRMSALGSAKPMKESYLIYKDEDNADCVMAQDFERYYQDILSVVYDNHTNP